eukprot:Em0005g1320a
MMEATPEGFESWLTDYLNQLQLDGEVYSGYIHGTLLTTDDDFAVEDVEKYVLDVVSGFIEEQSLCVAVCKEIASKWCEGRVRGKKDDKGTTLNLAGRRQASQTTHKLTREEKQQLLEQYGCQSSDEDDEYPFV